MQVWQHLGYVFEVRITSRVSDHELKIRNNLSNKSIKYTPDCGCELIMFDEQTYRKAASSLALKTPCDDESYSDEEYEFSSEACTQKDRPKCLEISKYREEFVHWAESSTNEERFCKYTPDCDCALNLKFDEEADCDEVVQCHDNLVLGTSFDEESYSDEEYEFSSEVCILKDRPKRLRQYKIPKHRTQIYGNLYWEESSESSTDEGSYCLDIYSGLESHSSINGDVSSEQ